MSLPVGELPGTARTRDELLKQETAGKSGEARRRAIRGVDSIMRTYDARVRAGDEPYPQRKD